MIPDTYSSFSADSLISQDFTFQLSLMISSLFLILKDICFLVSSYATKMVPFMSCSFFSISCFAICKVLQLDLSFLSKIDLTKDLQIYCLVSAQHLTLFIGTSVLFCCCFVSFCFGFGGFCVYRFLFFVVVFFLVSEL